MLDSVVGLSSVQTIAGASSRPLITDWIRVRVAQGSGGETAVRDSKWTAAQTANNARNRKT